MSLVKKYKLRTSDGDFLRTVAALESLPPNADMNELMDWTYNCLEPRVKNTLFSRKDIIKTVDVILQQEGASEFERGLLDKAQPLYDLEKELL